MRKARCAPYKTELFQWPPAFDAVHVILVREEYLFSPTVIGSLSPRIVLPNQTDEPLCKKTLPMTAAEGATQASCAHDSAEATRNALCAGHPGCSFFLLTLSTVGDAWPKR